MNKKSVLQILLNGVILICYCAAGNEYHPEKNLKRKERSLLFPQFTTLQTSMCLIAQISSLPSHRVAINTGFQTNYQLPYQLPSFYSPIFWARKFSKTSNPLVNFFERMVEHDDENLEINKNSRLEEDSSIANKTLYDTTELSYESDLSETTEEVTLETINGDLRENVNHDRSKRMLTLDSDITAGMFYNSIIDILDYAGYHEDCMLKSVCELAKHPLHIDDSNEDIAHEIVHLLLTPSVHQSFDPEREAEEKELYEEAERIGNEGGDCESVYNQCKDSPLYLISNFIPSE